MRKKLFVLAGILFCLGVTEVAASSTSIAVIADGDTAFWTSVRDAMKPVLEEQDVTLDFKLPEPATAEQQQKLARELVAKDVQAIAISPINPTEQAEALKAVAGEIPLVTLMQDAPESGRAAFLARDDNQVGQLLGQGILKNLPPGIKVMAFCKKPDSPETLKRIEGLKETLGASGTILDGVRADQGDRMIANAVMEEIVATRPEIAALIGLEAYHGPPMLNAVKAAGRERMVRVVGFGRTPEMEAALKAGMAHAVVCDDASEWGALLSKTLVALAKNEKTDMPEDGIIAAPITTLQTESNMTMEEMMHEIQVQVPWISEVAPSTQ